MLRLLRFVLTATQTHAIMTLEEFEQVQTEISKTTCYDVELLKLVRRDTPHSYCPAPAPVVLPKLVSPYTSSVLTFIKRRIVPAIRLASSNTCVPYVLFKVNARLFPNELSTCVCRAQEPSTRGSVRGAQYIVECTGSRT